MKVNVSSNQIAEQMVRQMADEGPVIFLDSGHSSHPSANYSYLAAKPVSILKAFGDTVIRLNGTGNIVSKRKQNPWVELQEYRSQQDDWLFGYIGYDMKNFTEDLISLNTDPVGAPDLFFMVPSLLLKIDNRSGEIEMLKGEVADSFNFQSLHTSKYPADSGSIANYRSRTSKNQYLERILLAQHKIREGEFYEINISRMMEAEFTGDPLNLYFKMQQRGPVPFGAYLAFDDIAVCCLSPERFLCKEGDRVFSQPIKGTRKRAADEFEDRFLKEDLKYSEKDRAENLMIVDLVRNDLSRIARNRSVEVSGLFEIQTFDTVYQMVSTIEANTDCNDPVEIIKTCFPMGSMTGAPKISAMKAIEEMEDYRRGIYSGAIGYFKPGYDFDFNVVIRTAMIKNGKLFYSVGGAVTSDSVPEEEWEETVIKTKALTSVFPQNCE